MIETLFVGVKPLPVAVTTVPGEATDGSNVKLGRSGGDVDIGIISNLSSPTESMTVPTLMGSENGSMNLRGKFITMLS
jgi:hypothetical protein